MRNKRGIAVMVSYVLAVIAAIALGTVTYTYLKAEVPQLQVECSPETSIVIEVAKCNVDSETLAVKIINDGLFNIDGLFVRFAEQERETRAQINEGNETFLPRGTESGPLKPGEIFITRYNIKEILETSVENYILEIQPAQIENNKLLPCKEMIISREVLCIEPASCESDTDCNDGVPCTLDICIDGICSQVPDDSACTDDGLFCNGVKYCDPDIGCIDTGDPCLPGEICDEPADTCETTCVDLDNDDWNATSSAQCGPIADCNDANPNVNPGISNEISGLTCSDGLDNDCDGPSDCADSDCASDASCAPTCAGNGILYEVNITEQSGSPAIRLFDSGDQGCGLGTCYTLMENWRERSYPDEWLVANTPDCGINISQDWLGYPALYKAECYCKPNSCSQVTAPFYAPMTTVVFDYSQYNSGAALLLYWNGTGSCGAAQCQYVQKGEFINYEPDPNNREVNWTTLPNGAAACDSNFGSGELSSIFHAYRAYCAPPVDEFSCTDGIDNDCDGSLDCIDSDCASNLECLQTCSGNVQIFEVNLTSDGQTTTPLYTSADEACALADCYGYMENWRDNQWGDPFGGNWVIGGTTNVICQTDLRPSQPLIYKALCYCRPADCAQTPVSFYAPITTQYYQEAPDGTSIQSYLDGMQEINTGSLACGAAQCQYVQKGELLYGPSERTWNWTTVLTPCGSIPSGDYAFRAHCTTTAC